MKFKAPVNVVVHPAIQDIVQRACKSLSVRRIWLFGSRARGTHRDKSDIDMAFELVTPGAEGWSRFVAESREEAPTLLSLDLVDMDTCDVALREAILREGVLLYGR